jgi:hypothetical protein
VLAEEAGRSTGGLCDDEDLKAKNGIRKKKKKRQIKETSVPNLWHFFI